MVMGLNDVPNAGDTFRVVDSEKEARAIVADRPLGKRLPLLPRK
jgi:hypothetical protein